MNKHLLLVLLLGLLIVLSAACGGGGGARAPITPANPNNSNNQQPPSAFQPAEVSVPQVAESIGEVGGIVADFHGVPIPDLEVYLNSPANVISSTDAEGKFLASGINSGDHTISIGVEGIQVASYEVAYDASMPLNLAISPVGLRKASSENEFGRLKGHAFDASGRGLSGVKVLVFNNERFFMLRETKEGGFYEYEKLPAGSYGLIGFKRGYRTHVGNVQIESDKTTTYDFTMQGMPVGRIIGVVKNEEGEPLPRTHIFLIYRDRDDGREPPAFHTLTNQSGEYVFENVPAASADMLAFRPEYEPEDAAVTVPPQGHIVQNFTLRRIAPPPPPPPDHGVLSGKVFNQEEQRIPGALIVLERPDLRFTAETNEDGFYKIAELPIGPYAFVVSAEGYDPVSGQLTILPGQNIKNFFLGVPPPPKGNIEGTVLWGESEDPVAGAIVELWVIKEDGILQKLRETESRENGRYAFLEVPAGSGVIKAYQEDASGVAEYHLPPGGNLDITVRIFPNQNEWAGKIVGRTRIHDPNKPDGFVFIPGAEVKLYKGEPNPQNPPIAVTTSNGDALYKFENLPPTGEGPAYWVVATKQIEGVAYQGANHTLLGENQTVELHITMEPLLPTATGKIHGVIKLGETSPPVIVPGALVKLFHGEPGPNNPPIRTTESGENGYYAFPELSPSGSTKYFVTASKLIEGVEHYGIVHTLLEQGEVKIVNVCIFPKQPPANAKIHGHIVIGETDPPVKVVGASVKLFHGEPGPKNPPIRTTTSGENGYYAFPELLPSGDKPYFVYAAKLIEGVEYAGIVDAFLNEGKTIVVNVPIFPRQVPDTGSIQGKIKRVNPENPLLPPVVVPGALVKLYLGNPDGQEPIAVTESNAQGHYAFLELDPTGEVPYVIVASKWINEVLFVGAGETHLDAGQNKELHIMIYPPE